MTGVVWIAFLVRGGDENTIELLHTIGAQLRMVDGRPTSATWVVIVQTEPIGSR